jgi:hypothetical protein
MGMTTRGRVYKKFDAQQVTDRFRKREFVLELTDNPRYPQMVMFQLTGDRCEQLDDIEVDDQVEVEFSLRGREWTSPSGDVKYFNSLDVWQVATVGQKQQASGGASDDEPPPNTDDPPPGIDEDPPF